VVVHLQADDEVCRQRDREGNYGEERPVMAYEAPESADLVIDTGETKLEDVVTRIQQWVEERGFLQ
jgi:adenylylsulfate kinase-like enzyme